MHYHYIFKDPELLYRPCTFSVRVWPANIFVANIQHLSRRPIDYRLLANVMGNNNISTRVSAHPRVLQDMIEMSLISCYSHVAS
jgi:hypothetical protein